MSETEGLCDDCNGPMESMGKDLWYCRHCEIYLEWHEVGYYVYMDDDEVRNILKSDTT